MTLSEGIENTIEILMKEEAEGKLDYSKAYGESSVLFEILSYIELDLPNKKLEFYKNILQGLKSRSHKWIWDNYELKNK